MQLACRSWREQSLSWTQETPYTYRKARRHRERADHGAAGLDGVDAEAGHGEDVEQLAGDAQFQLPLRRHRPHLDLAPVVFQLLGHAPAGLCVEYSDDADYSVLVKRGQHTYI